jgi:MFS family permease
MAMDRWGARFVFAFGAGLLAIGLFLSSLIQTLGQLILTYGVVVGLGITVLGLGPQAGLLASWFRRRLGLAIGLAFAGTGLGTLILTPGVELIISNWGWRAAYRLLAMLALLLIPLILIFIRRSPRSFGRREHEKSEVSGARHSRLRRSNWTMSAAVRTHSFWLVMIAAFGAIGPLRMLTVHQLAVAVGAGYDRLYAAAVIGFSGLVTAVAFVGFGYLSDRIGRRKTYVIGSLCLLMAIAILSRLNTAQQASWLLAYALLLGAGEGSRSSLVTAVASDLFPGNALGSINGAVGSAFGAGAALFPWFAGRIFDLSGAYTAAFVLASAAVVVSTIALWLAKSFAPRNSGIREVGGQDSAD